MNEVVKKLFLLVFTIFFVGSLSASSAQEINNPYIIQQNTDLLNERNGEIVDQKQIQVESKFGDDIDCYRIKYLSDNLEIVGFICTQFISCADFTIVALLDTSTSLLFISICVTVIVA